jgi:hypothetical protein
LPPEPTADGMLVDTFRSQLSNTGNSYAHPYGNSNTRTTWPL